MALKMKLETLIEDDEKHVPLSDSDDFRIAIARLKNSKATGAEDELCKHNNKHLTRYIYESATLQNIFG